MKNKTLLTCFLIIAFGSVFSLTALSQARHIYKIDASGFPEVRAQMWASNATGWKLHLENGYFDAAEDGESMNSTIRIDSSRKADTPGVSVLIFVDLSSSMAQLATPGVTKLQWVQMGLHAFLDSLKFQNGTTVRILPFCNGTNELNIPNKGFYDEPAPLKEDVDRFQALIGKTDLKKSFLGSAPNPFDVLINDTPIDQPRHIIFISDGPQINLHLLYPDADEIIEKAQAGKIVIHSIQLLEQYDQYTEWFIKGVGGLNYTVRNSKDVLDKFKFFAGYIQDLRYYQLTWDAPYGCDEASRTRSVRIQWYNNLGHSELITDFTGTYLAPESSIESLGLSEDALIFGPIGTKDTLKKVRITYKGPGFVFTGIEFDKAGFSLSHWEGPPPPFNMIDGDTRRLTIIYDPKNQPTEANDVAMTFTGDDFMCDFPEVKLTALCSSVISGEDIDFGKVMETHSSTIDIAPAFENTSTIPLRVTASINGPNSADFIFDVGGVNETVPPGGSIDISIMFQPSSVGNLSAYIEFTVDPEVCFSGDNIIDLAGEGDVNAVFDEKRLGEASGINVKAAPNPASGDVNIKYETYAAGRTSIGLYNSFGALIEELIDRNTAPGEYSCKLALDGLPSGVYFLRLQSGGAIATERLVIAR